MATLGLPSWGYGLRYTHGIFKQLISQDGSQLEAPDPWLDHENVSTTADLLILAAVGDFPPGRRL
jgi:glucan phosphorylase